MTFNPVQLKNTAKAICVNADGHILMLCKTYEDGSRCYTLPGGSQEPGESLVQALIRECEEEIGCRVEPGPLRYICEFMKDSRTAEKPPTHKVEFGFSCLLPTDYTPQMGPEPDPYQSAVEWVEPGVLCTFSTIPANLARCLQCSSAEPVLFSLL